VRVFDNRRQNALERQKRSVIECEHSCCLHRAGVLATRVTPTMFWVGASSIFIRIWTKPNALGLRVSAAILPESRLEHHKDD